MRSFLIFSLALLLVGCKSHKEAVTDTSLSVDSIARYEHHRTIATIDSAIRHSTFDFDTLEVCVEKPSAVADKPEIIRLKAIKGRVIDRRRVQRNQVEVSNRLDTVAYHQSAAETSTEHSATTRLYNPPDGSLLIGFAIIIIAGGIILYIRKRK